MAYPIGMKKLTFRSIYSFVGIAAEIVILCLLRNRGEPFGMIYSVTSFQNQVNAFQSGQ
jgi:hypothetical protein